MADEGNGEPRDDEPAGDETVQPEGPCTEFRILIPVPSSWMLARTPTLAPFIKFSMSSTVTAVPKSIVALSSPWVIVMPD